MKNLYAKRFCLTLVLLSLLSIPALTGAQDKPPEYATLVAALKAGNTNIDYTRLRMSYVESPEHKKFVDMSNASKAMYDALQAKDYAGALKNAKTVLDSEYVNLDAHFVASIANHELGKTDKAEFHKTVFRGLIDSIRSSGDGKSPEKAWVVISVHEEYVVLRMMGFVPSQQSLLHKDGHFYDEMKVKNPDTGEEATYYFNTDIPMKEGL
jgi:hypothetical protein